MDLHAAQIQGFFNIPVDHMFASPVMVGYFRKMNLPNLTVVSPDAGGVERARFFATKMGAPLAIVDKRRTDMNVTEVMNVIGDVKGRTCLIIDDIMDTAGTLVKTAEALLDAGARQGVCVRDRTPVLSGPAIERIASRSWRRWWSPTPFRCAKRPRHEPKIKVLSIAGLLGARDREHSHGDVRELAVYCKQLKQNADEARATMSRKGRQQLEAQSRPARARGKNERAAACAWRARFPPWFTAPKKDPSRSASTQADQQHPALGLRATTRSSICTSAASSKPRR